MTKLIKRMQIKMEKRLRGDVKKWWSGKKVKEKILKVRSFWIELKVSTKNVRGSEEYVKGNYASEP